MWIKQNTVNQKIKYGYKLKQKLIYILKYETIFDFQPSNTFHLNYVDFSTVYFIFAILASPL